VSPPTDFKSVGSALALSPVDAYFTPSTCARGARRPNLESLLH